MHGIALIIALSSLGVDYSWRTTPEGEVEYVLQVEPEFIQSLVDGEEIHSDVPAEVGTAQRLILRIGTKEAPKTTADVTRAKTILRSPSRISPDYPTILWRVAKAPEETAAATYGWQPGPEAELLYYLQIDPTVLRTMQSGDEIHAIVRPEAGRVGTFVVVAGTKQLPRVASKTPLTSPSAAPAIAPATGSAFNNSPAASNTNTRPRFNASNDSFSNQPGGLTPPAEQPLYPTRNTPPAASQPPALEPAPGSRRPRFSSTTDYPDPNSSAIAPVTNPPLNPPLYPPQTERPATGRSSLLLDPPTTPIEPANTGGNLYPAPMQDYRSDPRVTPVDDRSRQFDPNPAPNFNLPADNSANNRYQDPLNGGYQNPAAGGYQNPNTGYQNPNVPFNERQTGFNSPPQQQQPLQQQPQYPAQDDRFASRAPNTPVGASRPLMNEVPLQGSTAVTQTMLPQTPAQGQLPVVPAIDPKAATQTLSAWSFLWCLVFFSVGGNLYLGWTAAEFYSRYKLANERLRTAGR